MSQRVIDGVRELQSLIGQEVGVSDWLTVTQDRIDAFSEVTEDHQWIHSDPERARVESPYGTTIAHGFLTLSLMSGLISQAVRVSGPFSRAINYGLNRVRFPAPVRVGSRIRARCTLHAVEEITGGLQMTWLVRMECEGHEKPVLVAESVSRLYSEAAPSGRAGEA